jgi:hypothetical protein
LNWNNWIRQIHRWLSIASTATVVANFVAMGLGGAYRLGGLLAIASALSAHAHRSVHVRAAVRRKPAQCARCRRIAQTHVRRVVDIHGR